MNADRVKRKLPCLLVDGSTTEKNNLKLGIGNTTCDLRLNVLSRLIRGGLGIG